MSYRENKHKQLTSHTVAKVLLCAGFPAYMTRTDALVILVAWRKEAIS